MNKYYAAVVVYNSLISDSETITNLSKIKNHNISIVVFDNSNIYSIRVENQLFSQKNGYTFLSENENIGLSKAYNKILDHLTGREGIVVWFDDDTQVDQNYFDVLNENINENYDIYVPVIKAQNGKFYSPNEEGFLKNKQLKSVNGKIRQKKFNAINSCTAVKLDVYKNYRYDEKLFLDQIDHDFFRSQRLHNKRFFKLPIIIHHNLSLKDTSGNIESVKQRFNILIPDYITYVSKKGRLAKAMGKLKIFGWGVQQAIKNKNIGFTFWVIRKFLINGQLEKR
ncbi:TPA: glycosyltransferase [Streptococcus suis]|nr:glycosyltransferase [Streptococcus suis]